MKLAALIHGLPVKCGQSNDQHHDTAIRHTQIPSTVKNVLGDFLMIVESVVNAVNVF